MSMPICRDIFVLTLFDVVDDCGAWRWHTSFRIFAHMGDVVNDNTRNDLGDVRSREACAKLAAILDMFKYVICAIYQRLLHMHTHEFHQQLMRRWLCPDSLALYRLHIRSSGCLQALRRFSSLWWVAYALRLLCLSTVIYEGSSR